ncbi:MAG TPA: histone deacetylase [Solirubrobacteraceae bacterium]|nr:histone deacetylase [Solirubrobacteraceae bacterium]
MKHLSRAGLYFTHPACLEHDPRERSPWHPDTPERLRAMQAALGEREWPEWEWRQAPAASEADIELVHPAAHVAMVRELSADGGGAIDADTFVSEGSFRAAQHAAGAARAMVSALLDGEAPVGFCGIRPAGHHAESARAMGFCLFNNIAIAAEHAIRERGLERVFILDWDVHHGNGTAEIFRTRADVLFASLHQWPLYPGTGPLNDAGTGAGEGFTINLPVPPGSAEPEWLSLLEYVVLRAARAFEPQLVLVSAGFDAHAEDPLASCRLQTDSFAKIACLVRDMAREAGVPLGVVLEGGYNVPVLCECATVTLAALGGAGEAPRVAAEQALTPHAAEAVGRYWAL